MNENTIIHDIYNVNIGYYGDALSEFKEDGCKLCQCYPPGTVELDDGRVAPCEQLTGHCTCKPHVIGRNCDKCEEGYYHILSGEVLKIFLSHSKA